MQESQLFLPVDFSVLPALDAWGKYASMRGKSVEDVMKKAMRYALDFAIAKTRKGNREKVRADLSRVIAVYKGTRKNSKAKASNQWRGTMAAAIIWRLNLRNGQTLAVNKSPAFYSAVAKFVNGREYAVNLHAAGWKPAQRALRGPSSSVRLPSFRKAPPGSEPRMSFSADLAEIIVENWASSAAVDGRPTPTGMQGAIGDRINEILPDLEALFTKFLAQDIMLAANEAGFSREDIRANWT